MSKPNSYIINSVHKLSLIIKTLEVEVYEMEKRQEDKQVRKLKYQIEALKGISQNLDEIAIS